MIYFAYKEPVIHSSRHLNLVLVSLNYISDRAITRFKALD